MKNPEYEALKNFLGCYFHQDFKIVHSSAEGAVNAFIDEEPADWVREVLKDLEELLAMRPNNEALAIFLSKAGCEYDPRANGWSELEWLQHIQSKLKTVVG